MAELVPWADQPRWKQRLLQQLQDTTARRSDLLHGGLAAVDGLPSTTPAWHTELQRVEQVGADLANRVRAHGMPQEWIDTVRGHGDAGIRFGDRYPDPDLGANRAREALIDTVADDIWQLQHTAVLVAARRERLAAAGVFREPDARTSGRVDQAMVGLWWRAGTVADTLALTAGERDQLWANDELGWRRIVEATVATYDDAELGARWRAAVGSGIDLGAFATERSPDGTHGAIPPLPAQMIAAAEYALTTRGETPDSESGAAIAAGVEATGLDIADAGPGTQVSGDQGTGPASHLALGQEVEP